jgi:hypothetical protein
MGGRKRRFEPDAEDLDLKRVQRCTFFERSGRKGVILFAFGGGSADPLREKVQARWDSNSLVVI